MGTTSGKLETEPPVATTEETWQKFLRTSCDDVSRGTLRDVKRFKGQPWTPDDEILDPKKVCLRTKSLLYQGNAGADTEELFAIISKTTSSGSLAHENFWVEVVSNNVEAIAKLYSENYPHTEKYFLATQPPLRSGRYVPKTGDVVVRADEKFFELFPPLAPSPLYALKKTDIVEKSPGKYVGMSTYIFDNLSALEKKLAASRVSPGSHHNNQTIVIFNDGVATLPAYFGGGNISIEKLKSSKKSMRKTTTGVAVVGEETSAQCGQEKLEELKALKIQLAKKKVELEQEYAALAEMEHQRILC